MDTKAFVIVDHIESIWYPVKLELGQLIKIEDITFLTGRVNKAKYAFSHYEPEFETRYQLKYYCPNSIAQNLVLNEESDIGPNIMAQIWLTKLTK